MLKTRIITAVVLLAVFFSALFGLSPLAWLVFATLVAAVAAWEWGALMAWSGSARVALGGALALVSAALAMWAPAALGLAGELNVHADAAWSLGRFFYVPAAVLWLVVVPLWMRLRWPLPRGAVGVAVGALVLLPTWLALVQLRAVGAAALVAVMAVAWIADTGAYFVGRAFGRHKLAPSISPGKTWEGAVGGGAAVLAYGFALAPKLPPVLGARPGLLALLIVAVTLMSVVGDLFESLLKRQAGLKDSSHVLPGHGGVLDRIDSLTSILPLSALIWLSVLN